jgi:hypothetical protein
MDVCYMNLFNQQRMEAQLGKIPDMQVEDKHQQKTDSEFIIISTFKTIVNITMVV